MKSHACLALAAALLIAPVSVHAQMPASPNGSEAQRAAINRLNFMDGEWRGEAVVHGPTGTMTLTQTERVGSMLGGSIKIIEGRGYAGIAKVYLNSGGLITGRRAFNAALKPLPGFERTPAFEF